MESFGKLLTRLLNLPGFEREVITGATVLIVLFLSALAYRMVKLLIHRLLRPIAGTSNDSAKAQRALTMGPLLESVARYTIAFVALVIILDRFGVDIKALLVSAGVIGLAIGLGAQSLVKDVITGFFLLFEGLIGVGDTIEVGSYTGVVESIGLRVTTLRTFAGALRIIPNGELTQFSNLSRGWGRAVVEVGVGYEEDVARALEVLDRVGKEWAASPSGRRALEPPQADGIIRFGDGEIVLRVHVKVDPQGRLAVEHELRNRIKAAFEAARIAMPKKPLYVLNEPQAEEKRES